MCNYSEEYLKNIISKVASACKLVGTRYSINKFDSIGQNYFGVLIPVVLSGNIDGKYVNIHIVMKLAPTDERYRVSGALTLFFSKEIFIYSTLLNEYKKIQEKFSPQSRYVSPNCYYICKEYCKEAVVIEDMRAQGYTLYTRTFLDYNHIVVSLTALAKFHALSFIVKIREEKLFGEFANICEPLNLKTNERFINILRDRLDKALILFVDTKYVKKLDDLRSNYLKYIEMMFSSVEGTVICHGDIWKENILFKYLDDKPVSACIIDYQTARLSSPAFDTLFLIITSTNAKLRKIHYKDLIDLYYSTFEGILHEAGLVAKDIYSKDSFNNDLETVAPASFIVANTALWLASGLQQEGHVRSKLVYTSEEERVKAADAYKNIIMGVLDDFSDYSYL